MNFLDIRFMVANFILLIGTILLIRAVWKNREILQGYSAIGALLTFIPLLIFISCYVTMGNWMALIFSSVTVLYWGMVCFYTMFKKKKKPKSEG